MLIGGLALLGVSMTHASAQQIESRTWLINGFASAVPFIGYGFTNLQKKIPNSELYSYIGPVEGAGFIQPKVLGEIRQAYKQNPDVEINLIGISFGANLLSRMVAELEKDGIPISYLGILDGLPLAPITKNVRRVDNFICNLPGCLRDKIRLTKGNDITIHNHFAYTTSHIALGDNDDVHQRILHQISTYPINIGPVNVDYTYTASTNRLIAQ
ncbi:MAG: hypothetical protein WAU16_00815 [Rhizobiaceae bacterium]